MQNMIFPISGKKGQFVWTEGRDEEALSKGVYNTYTSKNLRYSQVGQHQFPLPHSISSAPLPHSG